MYHNMIYMQAEPWRRRRRERGGNGLHPMPRTDMKNLPSTPATAAAPAAADNDLVALAAAGDARAFEAIMRRHNRLLFRAARSILKSDAETEDAVQEAYLSAWRALGQFRADAKLSTWLVRIVMNEALKRVRRRASNVVLFDPAAPAPDIEPEARMQADPDQQPDLVASRAEMRRAMETHILHLPEAFRTVFMLRAVEEMPVEEVAAALGIPEATVRTRFFRARALLREALSRDMDFALEDAFAFAGVRCDRIVARVLATIEADGSAPPTP
jgi:RNA polymerase sigma-70 factor, ECF subfamily